MNWSLAVWFCCVHSTLLYSYEGRNAPVSLSSLSSPLLSSLLARILKDSCALFTLCTFSTNATCGGRVCGMRCTYGTDQCACLLGWLVELGWVWLDR
ncbi:hypothetical protein BDV95DRAFT_68967 [Massariosphaeria phaeospora]|uniref:Secreted protein n=1 Tax=Massariosphaeria phaeospora TaxID=100035 RepID=A0A7C8I4R4_9PLEO|nr:hypothetical protein BDV95DRAFT_68967 [Massariosphaeria phaeospora]